MFELQVEFTPSSIHKFDTHIQVNVRGWKTISLRVGGTIEPPCVDIDVVSLVFSSSPVPVVPFCDSIRGDFVGVVSILLSTSGTPAKACLKCSKSGWHCSGRRKNSEIAI